MIALAAALALADLGLTSFPCTPRRTGRGKL